MRDLGLHPKHDAVPVNHFAFMISLQEGSVVSPRGKRWPVEHVELPGLAAAWSGPHSVAWGRSPEPSERGQTGRGKCVLAPPDCPGVFAAAQTPPEPKAKGAAACVWVGPPGHRACGEGRVRGNGPAQML